MADGLFDNVYNPDVLSCLANLSNDEVFTPPDIVNQMYHLNPEDSRVQLARYDSVLKTCPIRWPQTDSSRG